MYEELIFPRRCHYCLETYFLSKQRHTILLTLYEICEVLTMMMQQMLFLGVQVYIWQRNIGFFCFSWSPWKHTGMFVLTGLLLNFVYTWNVNSVLRLLNKASISSIDTMWSSVRSLHDWVCQFAQRKKHFSHELQRYCILAIAILKIVTIRDQAESL